MGLNDNQQAIAVFVSVILIAIGGVSVPMGAPWYVAFAIMIIGAIGFALKEKSGIISQAGNTNVKPSS